MESNRVSPIHLYLSTAIAALCVLWLLEQQNVNIKIIIFIQFIAIIVSYFSDVPLRKKIIAIYARKDKELDSIYGIKPYIKFMFIGTITIVASFGLAVFFIDYKNNPSDLLLAVSIITVLLIWVLHNWCAINVHKKKL